MSFSHKKKELEELDTIMKRFTFERGVWLNPIFVRISGNDIHAGLFLSNLIFWSGVDSVIKNDGWMFKTQQQIADETCLSRRRQQTARKKLIQLGLLEERRGNIVSGKMFFRISVSKVIELTKKDKGFDFLKKAREDYQEGEKDESDIPENSTERREGSGNRMGGGVASAS